MSRVLIPGINCFTLRACSNPSRRFGRLIRRILPAALGLLVLANSPARLAAAQAGEISPNETASLQSRLDKIKSSDVEALAKAFGLEPPDADFPSVSAHRLMQELGDLDGDGVPEYALEYLGSKSSAAQQQSSQAGPSWELFALAWDGARWQASPLLAGFETFLLQVLPQVSSGEREIALVVFAGATHVPYPVVFRFQAHRASLAWDGRSDESRYQGYDNGQVEFRKQGDILQMIASGRADPGFLVFPKSGHRGFDARTTYNWDGKAFIPVKTEYSRNRDFVLYRFIAALHLRDFGTAYSLVDAAKFLGTDQPSLDAFRKMVEDSWPEFLDDKIFRARDAGPDDNAFELRGHDKVYVYSPSFDDKKLLLTGLKREEREPDNE